MRLGLLETAVTITFWADSLGGPEVIPLRLTVCEGAFGERVRLPMGLSVGASLTALIPMMKVRLAEPPSGSVAVIVIIALPCWSGDGLIVTVRLVPVPARWMFALATRFVSPELAVTIKLVTGLSTSCTVKSTTRLGVSSLILGMLFVSTLISDGSLTAFTVK